MPIESIAVLGAGNMGNGIAQVGAMAGYSVLLFDVAAQQLDRAKEAISGSLRRLEEKKRLTKSATQITASIRFTSQFSDLKGAHFVIEAVTEKRDLKFKIFRDLDELLPQDVIFATNTSSISVTEIASQTRRPDKVAGMHFMNPVPIMQLVEGIRGLATSEASFACVKSVAERMGKTFIEAKDSPGFAVNRILMPMINEAFFALQENLASAKDIDQAMKLGCNFPMGPLELADFVGIDVCLFVCEILHRDLGDSKYRPAPLLRKYVEAGWLGRKSGRGVYQYA